MSNLEKTFSAAAVEKKWYQRWEQAQCFAPKKGSKKQTYSIIMPPPNVTGKLHMGHALDNICQDILIRYQRMMGKEVLWIPGTDHAGIATQALVEKNIYQTEKKTKQQLGRDEFLKRIWAWKETYGEVIITQLKSLGISCDWNYLTFTMDEIPALAVRTAFTELFNRGLIYQAEKIINWDPTLESAISDAEVDFLEVKGKLYQIAYSVVDSEEVLIIATTRPETLYGDTAVAVHPEDERYRHLIGKQVKLPLCQRLIPVVGDESVEREFGTGCLKITPGHDFKDFETGLRHQLPIINIMNKNGTFNHLAPEIEGLPPKEARAKTIQMLTELGQLIDVKDHLQQVGHGSRSGTIIEPMVSKQWFLNVRDLAKNATQAVDNGRTEFIPGSWENTFDAWLDDPKDWCLSRQLWWGHRIPVYQCQECDHQWASVDHPTECPQCRSVQVEQDPDVLDTWFSSGLWPMSTLGWPDPAAMKAKRFADFYPTSTLVTAYDIIFFWVARMMMMGLTFHPKAPPFKQVYIHAIVRDKLGRKMSKSLGNGIDPMETIQQYGADALRFTLAFGAGHNRFINLDPERIEGFRNFTNKLWNAYRFAEHFILSEKETEQQFKKLKINLLTTEEKWILSKLQGLIAQVHRAFEQYRFDEGSLALYSFTYDHFCSWFIEISKPTLYQGTEAAKHQRSVVLSYCLNQLLKLLHPICPFITEELYEQKNPGQFVMLSNFPTVNQALLFPQEEQQMEAFIQVVGQIRFLRADLTLSPKVGLEMQLFTSSPTLAAFIYGRKKELKKLANVTKGKILPLSATRPGVSVMGQTAQVEIYLPVATVIDVVKECDKLTHQAQKLELEIQKYEKQLQNQQFASRAPASVVEEMKTKMNECQTQYQTFLQRLARLREH